MESRVRGPHPQQLFFVLKEGMDLTLNRFPGLRIQRFIPCPGHDGEPCSHEFNHDLLISAAERDWPGIQCPENGENIPLASLLFGLHHATTEKVLLEQILQKQHELSDAFTELRSSLEIAQLQFLREFRDVQSRLESRCPNVFVLQSADERFNLRFVRGKLVLQLVCQTPGQWHPTVEGGRYEIQRPADWLVKAAPYLRTLNTILRATAPLIAPLSGITIPNVMERFNHQIELTTQIVDSIPDLAGQLEFESPVIKEKADLEDRSPATLRIVLEMLKELDPRQVWGNLSPIPTPEGHYLWLCDVHRQEYAR